MNEQTKKALETLIEKWEEEGRGMEDELRLQVGIRTIANTEARISMTRLRIAELKAVIAVQDVITVL